MSIEEVNTLTLIQTLVSHTANGNELSRGLSTSEMYLIYYLVSNSVSGYKDMRGMYNYVDTVLNILMDDPMIF
mgnify:FL=1